MTCPTAQPPAAPATPCPPAKCPTSPPTTAPFRQFGRASAGAAASSGTARTAAAAPSESVFISIESLLCWRDNTERPGSFASKRPVGKLVLTAGRATHAIAARTGAKTGLFGRKPGMKANSLRAPLIAALVAILAAILVGPAQAGDQVADFYQGKTIRMIIRAGVGGGYDQYSRLLGRYMGRHIPGTPLILPVNMPGGGGIVAANHVAQVAPRDGTILTMVGQGLVVDQALGINSSFKADLRTFNWIGNLSKSNQITVAWHTSKTKSYEDALARETLIGATGAGSISTQLPAFYNNILGTKFKIVHGYPDGRDVDIAMERGEVEGRGTNPWASYRAMSPRFVSEKL